MTGRRRLTGAVIKNHSVKRRRVISPADSSDEDSIDVAAPENEPGVRSSPSPVPIKNRRESRVDMNSECVEKQNRHIDVCTNLLENWEDRYSRLEYYDSCLKDSEKRIENIEKLKDWIEKAKSECKTLEKEKEHILESIDSMKEEEKRLEKVCEEVNRYQGCPVTLAKKDVGVRAETPNQHEINSLSKYPTLEHLLVKTEVSSPGYAPPVLQNDDLDEIEWPIYEDKPCLHLNIHRGRQCEQRKKEIDRLKLELQRAMFFCDFFQNNKHKIRFIVLYPLVHRQRVKQYQSTIRDLYTELTDICNKMEMIKASIAGYKEEEKRLLALQESRDAHFETIREHVNGECKCEICLEFMTHGDSSERCPKVFGSCGHTACAKCMTHFKVLQAWRCPECRTLSMQLFTNWAVMKMINPAKKQRRSNVFALD